MNKVIALAVLLGVAALCLWLERRGFDDHQNDRFQAALWQLQQLDTDYNYDVLRVRFSLLNTYDDFEDNRRESLQTLASLDSVPVFVSAAARARIVDAAGKYRSLLGQRRSLVERFKSQNAVVVNSRRYLPTVVDELSRRLRESGQDRELAALVESLSRAVLALVSGADGGAAEAQLHADELRRWLTLHPRHASAELASSLEHHARSLVIGETRLGSLTEALLTLSTRAEIEELAGIYEHEVAAALSRSNRYRVSFYAACLILLVTMGYVLWAQRSANRRLTRRVEERTAKIAGQAVELAVARDTAEAASRAKSAFLANMSHELRTPLNAILGYAQLLKRDRSLGERQLGAVATMEQSGEHLLTLISDILDLSKIEAGKLELCPAAADLRGFLHGIADIIRIRADDKAIAFRFDPAADLPQFMAFDEKRLRQVLLNLLGNAVKFTDHGQVSLQVSVAGRSDGGAALRFEVIDTGTGIPEEALEAIFRPFEQTGEAHCRAGGTGLGLSISRQLVRLMGSDIQVTSRLGAGSHFWFELALPSAEAAAAPLQSSRPVTGYVGERRSILVVDDTPANRSVLADLLRGAGFEVREAANGKAGLEQALAAAPDLVLMDIRMPVMDGLEATRRMRQSAQLHQTPIIAVSAGATADDGAASIAAGANAFVTKPIAQAQLLQEIGWQLRLSWTYDASPQAPARETPAEHLIAPPQAEIVILHRLALDGNMRGLKQRAEHVASLDPGYRAFADKLIQLAQGCQSKVICALVEKHLAEQETTS